MSHYWGTRRWAMQKFMTIFSFSKLNVGYPEIIIINDMGIDADTHMQNLLSNNICTIFWA